MEERERLQKVAEAGTNESDARYQQQGLDFNAFRDP